MNLGPNLPFEALLEAIDKNLPLCVWVSISYLESPKEFAKEFDRRILLDDIDFDRILEEARWELDMRGFGHVKFYVSGGIKEEDVSGLNPLVHGYGIGTAISNAPVVDFAMDIVEVDGKPLAKRGKWSGGKRVLACPVCGRRAVVPQGEGARRCPCGKAFRDLLVPAMDRGRPLWKAERPGAVRKRVLAAVEGLAL